MAGGVRNDSTKATSVCYYWAGCGYFAGSLGQVDYNSTKINRVTEMLGGASNLRCSGHEGGTGGVAGKGGNVTVDKTCKIYAYNGNRYSDGSSYANGMNQTPIYCQMGVIPEKYTYLTKSVNTTIYVTLASAKSNVGTLNYVNPAYSNSNKKLGTDYNKYLTKNLDMSKQGIGSGAGYTEISNGTYRIKQILRTDNLSVLFLFLQV